MLFNTKAALLILTIATCSNARCKDNGDHLRHGPPPRPDIDPSLAVAIHTDLTVYGRPVCPEQLHKDLQDEIAFALNINGTSAQVFVLPNNPHPHGPPRGPGGPGGPHHGGPGGPGGPHHGPGGPGGPHHGGPGGPSGPHNDTFKPHHDKEHFDDVEGSKAKIHEQCKEDEVKFCAMFLETHKLGGCMHMHLDEIAVDCKAAILKYDPEDWEKKEDWERKEGEEMTFRVIVFAVDEAQAEELRQRWAAMQPETLTEKLGKAQEVKVDMSAMAMTESAASEVEWIDAHHQPPPHHHHGALFVIGTLVCALAAAVVVAFRQRRKAKSLQSRLDYEMNDARNLATPTLRVNTAGFAGAADVVAARKDSLLDNAAAAGAPQMPEAVFNVVNPISLAAL
jgi:hypothetical protein